MNLVWFRTDLRLADNPALFHALNEGDPTMALFILTKKQHQIHGEAPQKYEFIKAHIDELVQRLKKLGVPSMVHEIPLYSDVKPLISKVIKTHPVKKVFINTNYWINEVIRDQSVKDELSDSGVIVREYHTNYLLPPGSIRKDDGCMYHVFTPYKNKFIEQLKQSYQLPLRIPEGCSATDPKSTRQLNVNYEPLIFDFKLPQWPVGEQAVSKRVQQFLKQSNYHEERDYPAIDGTSSLSPYLAIGVISAQQCLAQALKIEGEKAFNSTWVAELIWRDFYNDLMYEYPHLAKHQTFKASAKDDWHNDADVFKKWQAGKTGFPIIDAGMRQLLAEGWMHNRVRMLVASFLCKLCLIDWRKGEAHFMAHLLDGDLASNNGGWQWSSATGCDAAPYFRIFNPTTQSKKFDPDGTYIKKYLPELSQVDIHEIHDPKPQTRQQHNYPSPVIDYKEARSNALLWFKS